MSQTIKEYIDNLAARDSIFYTYNGKTKEGYYLIDGKRIDQDTIDAMFPIEGGKLELWNTVYKGENPDGTHVK